MHKSLCTIHLKILRAEARLWFAFVGIIDSVALLVCKMKGSVFLIQLRWARLSFVMRSMPTAYNLRLLFKLPLYRSETQNWVSRRLPSVPRRLLTAEISNWAAFIQKRNNFFIQVIEWKVSASLGSTRNEELQRRNCVETSVILVQITKCSKPFFKFTYLMNANDLCYEELHSFWERNFLVDINWCLPSFTNSSSFIFSVVRLN